MKIDLNKLVSSDFADMVVVATLRNTVEMHERFLHGFLHEGKYMALSDALESQTLISHCNYLLEYYGEDIKPKIIKKIEKKKPPRNKSRRRNVSRHTTSAISS